MCDLHFFVNEAGGWNLDNILLLDLMHDYNLCLIIDSPGTSRGDSQKASVRI